MTAWGTARGVSASVDSADAPPVLLRPCGHRAPRVGSPLLHERLRDYDSHCRRAPLPRPPLPCLPRGRRRGQSRPHHPPARDLARQPHRRRVPVADQPAETAETPRPRPLRRPCPPPLLRRPLLRGHRDARGRLGCALPMARPENPSRSHLARTTTPTQRPTPRRPQSPRTPVPQRPQRSQELQNPQTPNE